MPENTTSATPLWLEMRPEYIDANFERLSDYLKKNANEKKDSFHTETLILLHRRTEQYIDMLSSQSLSRLDNGSQVLSQSRKDELIFGVKLFGVFLLTSDPVADRALRIQAYLYQQLLLAQLCSPHLQKSIVEKALDTALSAEVQAIGYNWSDLQNDSPDVLASKVRYGKCLEYDTEAWSEELGGACIVQNKLKLMPCGKRDFAKGSYASSIAIANGKVEVFAPQSAKLRQSEQEDIDSVMKFTNDYISGLKVVDASATGLSQYQPDGDTKVNVRVTDISYNKIKVVTTDEKHQKLQGIARMGNVMCCNFYDCLKSFKVGDEFGTRYVKNENGTPVFEIDKEFIAYLTKTVFEPNLEVLARAERTNKGTTMWITEFGVPVYTQNDVHPDGERAILSITYINDNGYIYAQYQQDTEESFDATEARIRTLQCFCYPPSETKNVTKEATCVCLDRLTLSGIARALYLLQKNVQLPRERYRILCVIAILCKMTDDAPSFQMVDFVTQYIRYTIYFAQGNHSKIQELTPSELIREDISTDRRITIIEILRNYETITNPDFLEDTIQNGDESLSKLAKLVQTSNRMQGLLDRPLLNSILREITKMLSLEDESTKGLEEENGMYLGTEDWNREFKTSFVYPPNNGMQAAPQIQKVNVFKGVCAFLNSTTGGTLYLGVNDLGYVTGIQQDMTYLRKYTIDEYMRYITDEAKQAFGLDLMTYIRIVPMFDQKVVAIQVAPSEYKIAKLNDTAYIRINAESREMDDETASQMMSRKMHFDKDKASKEFSLAKAIEGKLKAVLHDYRSNSSDDCRDRKVEPISFARGHKHIWCYENSSRCNKMFSIARIGNVEVTNEPWTNAFDHKELQVDLFHMTGDKKIHVILKLDNMARNLLVEEFEGSENELTSNDNGKSWILETDVYQIAGIGRFYIGLAEHITIVSAPELKAYAQEQIRKLRE